MEGPAGTGKTMDSKVLSKLLGLPYTKVTCFSDMDSSDVTGAILPVAEEGIDIPIPSDDEIFFDPAGCYERITGKRLTPEEAVDISEADVRSAINEIYENFYSSQEGKNSPRYVYYASEIVKAFENGWLCEVQEPTCVADAAVLLILNSALEKEGVINLPQRTVKRHPECIFVMTTNRDYEGCRPLNQALRDRFNITKKVTLPSTEEQMERLSSATGCSNESFLRTVVESVSDLNGYLHNNGINASISLRGMQDFVMDCVRGFDLRESAMEDMIYKVSTDDEEVAEMENFLELSTSLFSASL
jgi:midasin (ATPase involved in ribosome maturation)